MADEMSGDQIAMASELRANGMSWERIVGAVGVCEYKIRLKIDPGYAKRKQGSTKKYRLFREEYKRPGDRKTRTHIDTETAATRNDAARLARQIPDDTRTLTARIFGDPLPGRSALDMAR